MTRVDYHRVIDLLALSFKANKDVHIENPEKKVDVFDLTIEGVIYSTKTCRMILSEYHVELILEKKNFEDLDFNKWLSSFEYECEQAFMRNIKIETIKDVLNYKVKVHF